MVVEGTKVLRSPNLIDKDTLARELGVSVNTLYAWVNQRKIPYVKVGRLLKFDRKDIEAWIEDRKIKERGC